VTGGGVRKTKVAAFFTYWTAFSLYIFLLQWLFNRTENLLAISLSIVGALPVALILAHRKRSNNPG
jgi:hypothetical protein